MTSLKYKVVFYLHCFRIMKQTSLQCSLNVITTVFCVVSYVTCVIFVLSAVSSAFVVLLFLCHVWRDVNVQKASCIMSAIISNGSQDDRQMYKWIDRCVDMLKLILAFLWFLGQYAWKLPYIITKWHLKFSNSCYVTCNMIIINFIPFYYVKITLAIDLWHRMCSAV
jgi:hypothetical protein